MGGCKQQQNGTIISTPEWSAMYARIAAYRWRRARGVVHLDSPSSDRRPCVQVPAGVKTLRQDRGSLVTLVHEPGFGECPLRDGLHHRSHCRPGWHMMPYPRGISSLTNFTAISISGALLSIHNQAFCIAEEFGVRENHQLDQGTLEEMVAFQKFETRCLRNM